MRTWWKGWWCWFRRKHDWTVHPQEGWVIRHGIVYHRCVVSCDVCGAIYPRRDWAGLEVNPPTDGGGEPSSA